jgi:hypothetical protein
MSKRKVWGIAVAGAAILLLLGIFIGRGWDRDERGDDDDERPTAATSNQGQQTRPTP